VRLALASVLAWGLAGPTVLAQPAATTGGQVVVSADLLPSAPATSPGGATGAAEVRTRVFLEGRRAIGPRVTLRASGWIEGLAARRGGDSRRAATVQPREVSATFDTAAASVTAGLGQVVWGRLDEFQPTDVVNPVDVTRFFLEGRAEARRAVGLVRVRAFLPRGATVDAVYVPVFRSASFDMLDEASSPFALAPRQACAPPIGCLPVDVTGRRPSTRWGHGQAGARLTASAGRVDWAVMAWRGFESVPLYEQRAVDARRPALLVDAVHPPTTVIGADVETVRGAWGLRAEAAWHVDDTAQAVDRFAAVPVGALDAGAGVDRRAGDYRVSASVIATWRSPARAGAPPIDRRDLQIVSVVERSFVRDTRRVRVFGVYNPVDRSRFVRALAAWSPRDAWWLEASAGWLDGASTDTLSRLAARDFVLARVRLDF
jgi:hypothetical protein